MWLSYFLCVGVVAMWAPGGGMRDHDVGMFLLVNGGVLVGVVASYAVAMRRSHEAVRWLRAVIAVVGLPVVFSALCWLLPAVHPEPYEYVWLAWDRWLFGDDLAHLVTGLPTWLVELLQLHYVCFYGLCIAAPLLARAHSGGGAFDRAVLLMVGGFLSSYLGYLLWPTIAPKMVLADAPEVGGLWLAGPLREWVDAAESHHWDCFPSGHTMMTTISLIIIWRWARPLFAWLLLPCLALIASTVLLHYHWLADVVVGAVWAWPCVRLCDYLADRDAWPTVQSRQ